MLSCFIQQCVYIRFACPASECDNSNPVLRAETLVVHCKDDDSTPLINRTFRGHQDWPLICHFVYYPLQNETTDGVYHCILAACSISKLFPWPVKTGKTSLKPFVQKFPFFSQILISPRVYTCLVAVWCPEELTQLFAFFLCEVRPSTCLITANPLKDEIWPIHVHNIAYVFFIGCVQGKKGWFENERRFGTSNGLIICRIWVIGGMGQ